MFFSAYVGNEAGVALWEQAVAKHAQWLGLSSHVESPRQTGSVKFAFAWLEHASRRIDRYLYEADQAVGARTLGKASAQDVPPRGASLWDTTLGAADGNTIRLIGYPASGELSVIVPPTTPEQIYYARTSDGYVLADDLRLFSHVIDTTLDEHAVYALLQFSAIPPSRSLYKNVRRVPNGHAMRVQGSSPATECTPFFLPVDIARRAGGEQEAEHWIEEALDAVLAKAPTDAVLYFSGGVDSGLIAARFAHLGRRDVRLVNYAFDATDEEHLLAVRMAAHFGFQCELVSSVPGQAADVLDRVGHDYSFPFGDISTIPTNVLVHASLPWAGQSGAVIEGTGADGAYGLAAAYPRWRRTYAIPRVFRELVGRAYQWLDLWRFDSRMERACRFARKSAALPLPHAVIAQNALEGIAYDAPRPGPSGVVHAMTEQVEAIMGGVSGEDRLSLLDLMWVCAGRMAPKSFDPLRVRGIHAVYPFLEPSMVAMGLALPWATKCAGGQAKGILKRMLAREVPPDWVYRRKTGFTRSASSRAMFASAPIQDFLHDVVLSPHNSLADYCRVEVVRRLVDRARHDTLSVGAHIFLWTLAFASAWVRQQAEAGPRRTDPPSRSAATLQVSDSE